MLAKVNVVPYNGNNIDMGTAVGKFYRVSAMTIIDAGECAPCALIAGAFAVACLGGCRSGRETGQGFSQGGWGGWGACGTARALPHPASTTCCSRMQLTPRLFHVVRR